MSYIRIGKHYLHTAYLVLGAAEFIVLFGALYALYFVQASLGFDPQINGSTALQALLFALVLSAGTLAMGVYLAMVQEGFIAMFFRTLVAFCFLGVIGLMVIYLFFPPGNPGSSNLFWAIILSTGVVVVTRSVFTRVVDSSSLSRRVVIYGSGQFAQQILDDYSQNMKSVGIQVIGCVPDTDSPSIDASLCLPKPVSWYQFCKQWRVSEIVIAPEERRSSNDELLADLMECKLRGVEVTNALDFYERSAKKAKVSLIYPSWILYSEGFKASKSRDATKRLVDLIISFALVVLLLPFIIGTALAIFLETGRPILYSQQRVGALGKIFRIYKFRSMRQDAEKEGKAIWAQQNDQRVTRVGAFIRNTRLDEIPQLYNVVKGEMSIVGPRPERPEFVEQLKKEIPFYYTRHYVKPGLMGWAQLNYPYGASVEDARGKLEYDLYYSKNHSFLIDLLIMIQTVEVVLLGKGVR
ncbi:MAG: TIGR03013 family XrtA/PEP-CTERM system glycosyltransferase [Natronospirillum sp.]